MQTIPAPVVKDLVLVGGGHSHVHVLKGFGMRPIPGVRLTLITKDINTPYSGMLPGLIAGHYHFDETHIDLGPLSEFAGARLYHDEVTFLDLDAKRIICLSRPPVPYDIVSINIGSTPTLEAIPGAEASVVPVKPISNFLGRWYRLKKRIQSTSARIRVGVVGAGVGGVELILSVQYSLKTLLQESGRPSDLLEFHLFTNTKTILPTHNRRVRSKFQRVLQNRGIQIHSGLAVLEVHGKNLLLEDGSIKELEEILWVTQASAPSWLRESGLDVDNAGFLEVNETLESSSHKGVFAAGDIAAVLPHPREKSGVFAVRQGKPLEQNLRRSLLGLPPKPFRPQKKFLNLISTGNPYAIASRGIWSLEGRWVWLWKDWVDRRFMARFANLPEVISQKENIPVGLVSSKALEQISAHTMRCRGCGAKVGASILEKVLDRLDPGHRSDIVLGLDQAEDTAAITVPPDKILLQSVDMFPAIIDDPYIFGQIVANHSLSDIFAMGGQPQSALAIATLPLGPEEKMETALEEMLRGVLYVLKNAGAALTGGHTLEGNELALGLSVSGLVKPEGLLHKGGMIPGDHLILTKPLGTGTLFAAHRQLKAKGCWISGALESMLQSSQRASSCLLRHSAHACADITGFGLLGHLLEMVRASGTGVRLSLTSIPSLEGAMETIQAGIVSSLQDQNIRLHRAIRNFKLVSKEPAYQLIFDPQTSGGLLASIPARQSEACVATLKSIGYRHASIIGIVEEKNSKHEPILIETKCNFRYF